MIQMIAPWSCSKVPYFIIKYFIFTLSLNFPKSSTRTPAFFFSIFPELYRRYVCCSLGSSSQPPSNLRKTIQHSFLPLHDCIKYLVDYHQTTSSTILVESSILPRLYPANQVRNHVRNPKQYLRSSSATDTTTISTAISQHWILLPRSKVSATTPRLACTFLSGFANGSLPQSRLRSVVNAHCTKLCQFPTHHIRPTILACQQPPHLDQNFNSFQSSSPKSDSIPL